METSNGVELFARKCTCTGKGMNSGYEIEDHFAIDERCADILAKHSGYQSYKQMNEFATQNLNVKQQVAYYGEWEPEDYNVLYDTNGVTYHQVEDKWVIDSRAFNKRVEIVPEFIDHCTQSFEVGKIYTEKAIEECAKINEIYVHRLHNSINAKARIGRLALHLMPSGKVNIWFIFNNYFAGDRCFMCVYLDD